jgi:pentapeptide MXKDX repeat protein
MKKRFTTMLIATVLLSAFGAATAHAQEPMAGDNKAAGKMAGDKAMDDKMPKDKNKKSKKPKKERMKDGDKMSKDGMSSHQ